MATDFTQDAVLHFLQSGGGSVRNSELLLHFRPFIREHPERERNRELFKKFVNSVATVQQVDGVSCVVLRKKYRGHVPGTGTSGGERGTSRPPRETDAAFAAAEKRRRRSPAAGGSDQPPPGARPAEAAEADRKSVLPAAGLVLDNHNNNNMVNLKQQHVPGGLGGPRVSEVPAQRSEVKYPGPPPGVTPAIRQNGGPAYLEQRPAVAKPSSQQYRGPGGGSPAHHGVTPPHPGVTLAHPQITPPHLKIATSHPEVTPPHPAVSLAHRGVTPPHLKITAPHPEVTPPPPKVTLAHPRITPPHLGVTPAIFGVTPPHPEVTLAHPTITPPHSGVTPPHLGVTPAHSEVTPPHLGVTPADPGVTRRHFRHRQSYKAAMSCDEDDDDDAELGRTTRGPARGGAWAPSTPLGSAGRAISASTPCIVDPPASPPAGLSSTPQPLPSGKRVPQIYIQGARVEPAGRGLAPEAERRLPPPHGSPQQNLSPNSLPRGSPLELGGSPEGGRGARLSSSHSSLLSPSPGPSPGLSPSPSRGSPWNSSYEDLQTMTGGVTIQEALQRARMPRPQPSAAHYADSRAAGQRYHSSDNLYQEPAVRVAAWHHSTGDLQDDPEEGGSSDGSASPASQRRRRPTVARRLSSQLRSRMCRSLGADLDQLLQEEAQRGHEAARLGRLQLLSSSLSLGRHLSSSSLSSCQSLGDLAELPEGGAGGRGLPPDPASTSSPAHRDHASKQALVPLEPREHAWLVKGAAGAWPDIYSLFREDPSLLNRQDFISGFTVLHWIAKHGDHRVLNTLWYGVEKAGLALDVNARSAAGHTPLHVAAMHGHKNMMRLLVGKFQADVSRRDNAGKRPWHYLSPEASGDVFQLLGASPPTPGRRAGPGGGGGGGAARENPEQQQQQRRRRRHHFSSASSGQRPALTAKVKRSSSLAAFLKHKSLQRFQGPQSDSSL